MNSQLNCTTIPACQPFVARLAEWVLMQYGQDKPQLARTLILLPTRRACQSLREAFLQETDGNPLLLPRILPIGEIEENEPNLWQTDDKHEAPPISDTRRHMLLTRLVMQFSMFSGSPHQSAQLAKELMRFIDEVSREGLDLNKLSSLAPEELAQHWQLTLDFLKIISHHWPHILEMEAVQDSAQYRKKMLLNTAAYWKKFPPAFPVIAAGSTGSQFATAQLLSVIAHMPRGMVVLPALDVDMEKKTWEEVSDTHPQYGLKLLLAHMGCERSKVKPLFTATQPLKTACLRTIFDPPNITAGWATTLLPLKQGLDHIKICEADTPMDEARSIALALRQTLETPGATAALVTHDRTLARMVVAQMDRLGIEIDDSAGMPLLHTPPGVFLELALNVAASGAAPTDLLALLQHPLGGAGVSNSECRQFARLLDKGFLRGIRRQSGLLPLIEEAKKLPALAQFLNKLQHHFEKLSSIFQRSTPVSLTEILSAHIAFAEYAASTDTCNGKEILWAKETGNQLAEFLADIVQHADVLQHIDPFSYPELFRTLFSHVSFRRPYGLHPRLHILSPIEARLQHYNVMVLSGLNEGSWPQNASTDPWMSRPMREAFGLPSHERSIGQSAHDFFVLCHAPKVLLTRAKKQDGAPTIASRWLTRLDTLVGGLNPKFLQHMQASDYYALGRAELCAPAKLVLLTPPEPKPPLSSRPRRMRATSIDQWIRDPYMIYAKYILGLTRLDAMDEDPNAADFGNVIHRSLEDFTKLYPAQLPKEAYTKLLECGKQAFKKFASRPAIQCIWWPRFIKISEWFIAQETRRRKFNNSVISECKGSWELVPNGKPFRISTRIDRIEIANDGSITLADYKTGSIPSKAEIDAGLANQLAIEALIVMNGLLEADIPYPRGVSAMEYWKLSANLESAEIVPVSIDLTQAQKRIEQLIARFDDEKQPYYAQTNPALFYRYNDYEHLTRRQEWETV